MFDESEIEAFEARVSRMVEDGDGSALIANALLILAHRVWNLTSEDTIGDIAIISESLLRLANKFCGNND